VDDVAMRTQLRIPKANAIFLNAPTQEGGTLDKSQEDRQPVDPSLGASPSRK
jgi:hypothetical protein